MEPSIAAALAITPASSARERTVDITTTGARTGRPRRIEIWFYRAEGEIYLSSTPAQRAWFANIAAEPRFTFHLRNGVQADLPAVGTPVSDPEVRERVFRSIIADLNQPWNPAGIPQPVEPLDAWLVGSPLIHVVFKDQDQHQD
jgi:hypothetical protein